MLLLDRRLEQFVPSAALGWVQKPNQQDPQRLPHPWHKVFAAVFRSFVDSCDPVQEPKDSRPFHHSEKQKIMRRVDSWSTQEDGLASRSAEPELAIQHGL